MESVTSKQDSTTNDKSVVALHPNHFFTTGFIQHISSESESIKHSASKIQPDVIKGNLFQMYQPFLKFGHISFIVPSVFQQSIFRHDLDSKINYSRKTLSSLRKVIFMVVQVILSAYSLYRIRYGYPGLHEPQNFEVLYWLWIVSFLIYFIYCVTLYMIFWTREDRLVTIFEDADALQVKLEEIGIPLCLNRKYRLVGMLSSSLLMLAGLIYALLSRKLSLFINPEKNANTVYGFVTFTSSCSQHTFEVWQAYVLALLGTTVDIYGFAPWFFAETLRLLAGLTMLKVFHHINGSLKNKHMVQLDLNKIIEAHMYATKLMRTFNDFMSPITFLGVLQSFVQGCYIVNIFLWNYGDWMVYLQYALLAIRNLAIYHITACVSSQAHAISDWLEDISRQPSHIFKSSKNCENQNDMGKLMIFTSQIYCKDSIGFKGFDYFTVSNSFVAGIVSLLITYTVIITQFKPHK